MVLHVGWLLRRPHRYDLLPVALRPPLRMLWRKHRLLPLNRGRCFCLPWWLVCSKGSDRKPKGVRRDGASGIFEKMPDEDGVFHNSYLELRLFINLLHQCSHKKPSRRDWVYDQAKPSSSDGLNYSSPSFLWSFFAPGIMMCAQGVPGSISQGPPGPVGEGAMPVVFCVP